MKWTGVNELRESFLSFFESKNHTRLASAALVPKDDPSLLLINSGMAPLKNYFLHPETAPNTKCTSCQKCIRTPDIENIGKTDRHGTYFEMLGNFSFGDYFKEEATTWAWEFFTKVLEIPEEKLYVTVYEEDDEAFNIWTQRRGVPASHVKRMGKADNFWEHGTGPCGPCSEIYFDRGPEHGCGSPDCTVGCECDRYMEVWNLVFTQFDSDGEGTYAPLDHPNIDTGMGLERLACVMQGVNNLFEVDTVQNIMKHISDLAGVKYHDDAATDVSLRVITDHIRSTTFMVGDGVTPSNEGRGYVLRRLLRRAARHGRLLGIKKSFLYEVASTVITENLSAYPELKENEDYIRKVIQAEEERFGKTVDQGTDRLNEMMERMKAEGQTCLSGDDAFLLHDTYGFPIDLTKDVLEENGLTVDEEEFARLMKEQRAKARAASGAADAFGGEGDPLAELSEEATKFLGYTTLTSSAKVVAMVGEGELTGMITEGQTAVMVLDQTPFYAESGGQVGDTGVITGPEGKFVVQDCQKTAKGHFAHKGKVVEGHIKADQQVEAAVDAKRRAAIARNHSSCHLLQAALREVLGTHVHQSGSYVNDQQCRFDFTHFSAMTAEEIQKTEDLVNEMIFDALPGVTEEMPIEEAKKLGAMALFGEKYGSVVRVCKMGDRSTEFCGGTHVDNTAKLGMFKIVSESSVAAGVRRIEATTGYGVLKMIAEKDKLIHDTAEALKAGNVNELAVRANAVAAELKEKNREIEKLNEKIADSQLGDLFANPTELDGVKVFTATVTGVKPDGLRNMADKVRDKEPACVVVLAAAMGEKGNVCVACGKDALARGLQAGKIIKEVLAVIGAKGGGRPDSAMGGTNEAGRLGEALAAAPSIVEGMLK